MFGKEKAFKKNKYLLGDWVNLLFGSFSADQTDFLEPAGNGMTLSIGAEGDTAPRRATARRSV